MTRAAEVAAESQPVIAQIEERHCGAQNVASRLQRDADRPAHRSRLAVLNRMQQGQGLLDVRAVVQRQSRVMARPPVHVCEAGVFLLEVRAVPQDDPGQRGRLRGAQHRSREAVAHQTWQVARVVEVGVSENNRFECSGPHRRGLPVPAAQVAHALEQADVDQHPVRVLLDQEPAAGDGAGRSEEREGRATGWLRWRVHGRSPPRRRASGRPPAPVPVSAAATSG